MVAPLKNYLDKQNAIEIAEKIKAIIAMADEKKSKKFGGKRAYINAVMGFKVNTIHNLVTNLQVTVEDSEQINRYYYNNICDDY